LVCDLKGAGVLVTRPAEQAAGLSQLISLAGGEPVALPALAIAPAQDTAAIAEAISHRAAWSIALFISANAVRAGLPRLQAAGGLVAQTRVAAVGKATAQALSQAGIKVDIVPGQRFDSEALLQDPALQDMAGKTVAIFRGEGGRELLAETLSNRGARIEYVQVYRRVKPSLSVTPVVSRWRNGGIHVVTVTSNEALQNLFDMLGDDGHNLLRRTPLVVISERGRHQAAELGIRQVRVSKQAGDEAILQAVCTLLGDKSREDSGE